jgi:iron-sulfur cluster assembly protein
MKEYGMSTEQNLITVTDKAVHKIQANLARRGRGVGIKIGVRTTGCSGLAYTLEYLDSTDNLELGHMKNYDQFCVFVSERDLPYFENLEIDYVRQGLNEGFEFRNRAEKDRCGCGESFRV